ncbi:toMV resistance protein Tm-2(2)-like [Rhododendron vialii]|uniref:toMV resistance protein Tm-2(2)-like n=1 Tax=Rhododendron vialii TaxID=182163 RepID=UPI00265EADB7|nr:toMV resistance protein Tm-2(2)-like [Rhododendron vialii]
MAAEAILGMIAQKAADIVVNQLIKESSCLSHVKEDLLWIETEMRRIQSYLEDAEAMLPKTKRVSNFIRDIWDLAYDVEDIIDTYFPKMRSRRSRWEGLLGCSNLTTARRFAKDVEGIKKRVDDITKARETFKIDESRRTREVDTWDPRRTFPHVDEPNVVGFDDLIKDLAQKVLGGDLHHRMVSIIGNAGLGKTTLARKVYNSVRQHFRRSAWICVSQQPNYKELLRDVARQVGLEEEKIEQDVEANLFAFLSRKRYVIVIDDIWHTKAWDALKVGLPTNSENGSRTILTSRITDVGVHAGGVNSILELKPLEPETSRELFYKTIVFDTQNTIKIQDSPQLEHIGEQILERCGGVPLAIVLAAGMLKLKGRSEIAWKRVLEGFQGMGQDKDEWPDIFALSYIDLPLYLKPCFLYLGLFPEDSEIRTFELINLWAAEGFIRGSGVREVEEVGDDYLNHLIARNLIQVVRRRFDGRVRVVRIHDMLHSLCVREANEINFFNIHTDATTNCNATLKLRRVAIHDGDNGHYLYLNPQTSHVRAMLCFLRKTEWNKSVTKNLLSDSKFLRVLRIDDDYMPRSLLTEICNLRQLTYLKLSSVNLVSVELPYAISNLKSLLTLDLRGLWCIYLPDNIWSMNQLRHIFLPDLCYHLPIHRRVNCLNLSHPVEFSLTNLQTLYGLPGDIFKADWLHNFTNLRTLRVYNPTKDIMEVLIMDVTPVSHKLETLRLTSYSVEEWETNSMNLSRYENLRKLHLEGIMMRKLPQHDKLPPNLTKITLEWICLEKDPMETLKKLQKLKILKLGFFSYMGKKLVCSGESGNFPQLEVLEVEGLDKLKLVVVEEGGMPRLKDFQIIHCYPETRIPDGMRNIMRTTI